MLRVSAIKAIEATALLDTAHEQEVHEVPHPLPQITELPVAPPVLGVKADAEFEHYDVLKSREPASEAAQAHSNHIIAERCRCRRICPIWRVVQKRSKRRRAAKRPASLPEGRKDFCPADAAPVKAPALCEG